MPTSRAILAKFTAAGLGAAASAAAQGLAAKVTHIAIGRGAAIGGVYQGYTPQRAQEGLFNEFLRAPISQAEDIAPNEVLLSAVFEAAANGPEAFIYEVGFYLENGQMFCLWSEPGNRPLTYRSYDVPLALALSLVIDEIPRDSIEFVIGGPSLSIINVGPMIKHAISILRLINRATETEVARFTPVIQNTWQ